VRIFPCQSGGQIALSIAYGQVFLMDQLRLSKLSLQRLRSRLRQQCHPVLRAFRITDRYLMLGEIAILDAATDAFHEA
jgi:hypothetical protein